MPKHNRSIEIESLLREFASRLETLVRKAVDDQVQNYVLELKSKPGARASAGVRMCPFPGCHSPAAGPRNRWHCRLHRNAPVNGVGSREVTVKVLKARGAPKTGIRQGPPMECRVEGCPVKSRGPRYNYMCAEHYRDLSPTQQKDEIAKWRQRREAKALAPVAPKSFEGSVLRRAAGDQTAEPVPATTAPTSALPELPDAIG